MTPRRPQRDYHKHRHDITARGLAAYCACPHCTHKHPIILTAAGAIALAQLLSSIEGKHQ